MLLGNDIVDLNVAKIQSNWRRKGYIAKIFTPEEKIQLLGSADQDLMIWQLWSMKEAVYKITHRENLKRFYNPRAFACHLNGTEDYVNFEDHIYYTKSVINENLIHTIASTKKKNLARINTYCLENSPTYLEEFNTRTAYFIEKDLNGIPYLVDKITGKRYAVTISHHGAYLAIASHLLL